MNDGAQSVAYFDSTFDEAMALAREARDYLSFQERTDVAKLSPVGRMAASCEAMRLTARMTQVIAWLLVQKAVHAGDLSRDDAKAAQYRLDGQDICDSDEQLAEELMPESLADLLARSHRLYRRVARLDAMLDSGQD